MINLLLPLDLQYFAEDGSGSPQTQASETNPVAEVPTETKVESSEATVEPAKTFTQAELDEMIAKRLDRERKKFADYDEIKTKASEYEAKLEEQRLAEMSEKERAEELAKKFETELNELKAQLDAKEKAIREQAIKNEFIKVATSANIVDIDAAIALSDLSAVSLDENGAVVGVADAISTLVENKPYLVAKKTTQPIGQATNSGTSKYVDKPAAQLLQDAMLKARRTGKHEDQMAYVALKRELDK